MSSLPNVALSFFFVNIYFYFFHIFIFSTFYKQNNSLRKTLGAHSILLLIFSIRYDSADDHKKLQQKLRQHIVADIYAMLRQAHIACYLFD